MSSITGRRSIAATLVVAMVSVVVFLAPPESDAGADPGPMPFTDVPVGHFFYDEIEWLWLEEITAGYPNNTFRPGEDVARQIIAAWFHAYSQGGAVADPCPYVWFSDVAISSLFCADIWWLSGTGITGGYLDGTFQPTLVVSRQVIAAFLYRLAGSPAGPFPDPGFPDVPPSHSFYTEIAWLASTGIGTGYLDGLFRPTDAVSRMGVAAFLYRFSLDWAIPPDPPIVVPDPPAPGFDSLFIGHSFFRPFASALDFHAPNAGYPAHTADIVFSGGGTGAPEALWNNVAKRDEIQAHLDVGDIELFGMTYHPDYPTLAGYRLWFDYALAANPDTVFFIAMPWVPNPTIWENATVYSDLWHGAHSEGIHGMVDDLRAEYPGVEIYDIPYGQAAGELYLLFEAGQLPDVDLLMGNGDAIFRDFLGHADDILLDLGELVWLGAIYDVDIATYDYDPGYITDLNSIADDILDEHDPAYDAP